MTSIEIILNTVFFKIWNMSIRAGSCILAVLLFRFLLQKFPRKYLYMLWLVVAFRLVCPVTLNTQFSLFNLEVLTDYGGVLAERPEEDQKSQEKTMEAGAESASSEQSPKKPEEESTAVSLGEMMQRPKSIRTSLREFLHLAGKGQLKETSLWRMGTCVWIAGMGVFAVYFAVGIVRMGTGCAGLSAGKAAGKIRTGSMNATACPLPSWRAFFLRGSICPGGCRKNSRKWCFFMSRFISKERIIW